MKVIKIITWQDGQSCWCIDALPDLRAWSYDWPNGVYSSVDEAEATALARAAQDDLDIARRQFEDFRVPSRVTVTFYDYTYDPRQETVREMSVLQWDDITSRGK